ncbi:ETC complex I subunit [Acuticoccus sp. MNP-M23]|uniref:ETC complex I subunit n=1 Tax=Acuticoccus sp. MNP-M23 TaxID=3072793 RepID=UPI0028168443|nr:ETC complex I subunit [Acuticoccus sp. MNP-M23]WMS41596.1 ETC complex I subunit [Acuticoccus sp. MNP-M23]
MRARIFKPARTAMQSGTRKSRLWRLEFVADSPLGVDPLMGWTSSPDTIRQVHLEFPTKEDAVAYAERRGIAFRIEEANTAVDKKLSYSDNFRTDRVAPWTH